MDAVLGLSVTPSAVGLVLVEGQDADGATVDHDEIFPGRRSTARQTCDEAAAAVLRSEAIAAARGHRLHAIGVTWSDDADTEASLLLDSLTECGFDNVVPVRLPEASEALAWGIAEVIGHDITAVCVIESATVIALIVHAREGAVQTAVNHGLDSDESLVGWLSAVFAKADWRPEALVMVGSGSGVDALMPHLQDVLGVPVFAPAEAELALARGAALASAQTGDLTLVGATAGDRPPRHRRRPLAPKGPVAMLAAGTVAFVVSVSVAISTQLTPDREPAEPTPAARSSAETAAAADPRPLAPPTPAVLPAPAAPPPPAAPPAPIVEAAPPEAAPPEAAPPEAAPPAVELPAEPPAAVADSAPVPAAPPPAPVAPVLAPDAPAPGLVPAEPTPVPERRGFLQRIRDRIADIGEDEPEAPAPVAPPVVPAPPPGPPGAPPLPLP